MADADSMPVSRACTTCSKVQPLEEFFKSKKGKYGRMSMCRSCQAQYFRDNKDRVNAASLKRYHERQEPKRIQKAEARQAKLASPVKICAHCQIEKSKEEFPPNLRHVDGFHSYCRSCCNERNQAIRKAKPEKTAAWSKKWVMSNRDKVAAKATRWHERNPGRATELAKQWREKNPERHKANGKRYVSQINVRVHRAVRTRLAHWIDKRSGRTFDILGFGVQELVTHLERQFVKGMDWSNYGSAWHIDHIIPLSSFVVSGIDDPLLRRAWALTNLRPLWAIDNLKKGAKLLHLI